MIRWLLWNLNCLRGRRCADMLLDETFVPQEIEESIAGTVVSMTFLCKGCGTVYRRDSMLGLSGNFVHLDRRRVA